MSRPDGDGYSSMEERCMDCPWKCNPMPEKCPIPGATYSIMIGQEYKDKISAYVYYREMAKECGLDSDKIEIVKAFMKGHSKAYKEINEILDQMNIKLIKEIKGE